jgi:putative membrane-bound dehydrogenase-like protein
MFSRNFLLMLGFGAWCAPLVAQNLETTVLLPRESAWTPEQERKSIVMDGPYEAQLVACEPLVHDPVEMTWDAKGRCFVADMMDYPLGPPEGQPPLSRIVELFDPDASGRYTKSRIFADHVDHVQGLLPYKDGLIATTRTQILFLRDTKGDGVADEIKPLIEGMNPTHSQLLIASPRWGLDNTAYLNNGLNGAEIYPSVDPNTKVDIKRCNLHWNPVTGKIEPTTGFGQYGGCFDDWGHHFFSSNRNPVMFAVMPHEAVLRNPHAGILQGWEDVAPTGADTRVYPLQLTHTTSDAHAGTHTAACGLGVYRGDLMPELRGEVFVCEPTAQDVVRYHLEPKGASFTATRVGDHKDFFRSRDEWCRPVNVTTGPDGAMYICDIYRRFIDHARFFPEQFVKTHNMRAGDNEGRIWRIVPVGAKARAITPAPEKVEDLVAWLGHPNAWQRETAQRLLMEKTPEELKDLFPAIEKKTKGMMGEIQKQAQEEAKTHLPQRIDLLPQPLRGELEDFFKKNPGKAPTEELKQKVAAAARLHSISHDLGSLFLIHWSNLAYGLVKKNGFEAMKPAQKVITGIFPEKEQDLDAPAWILRRQGANFVQSGLNATPFDAPGEFALLCAGKVTEPDKLVAIAARPAPINRVMAYPYFDDVWMQRAILSASSAQAGKVLAGIVAKPELLKDYESVRADFIRELASCSAADSNAEDVGALLKVFDREKGKLLWWKPPLLQGLAEGFPRSGKKLGATTLAAFVAKPSDAAWQPATAEISELLNQVDKVMTDNSASLAQRLAVVPLLAQRTWDKAEPSMRALFADGQPPEITTAAVTVLKRFPSDKTAPLLYELLPKLGPAERRDIVAMLSSGKTLMDFLHRMEKGEVPKSLVGAEQRWGYSHSANKEIKDLADKLFGTVNADRAAVLTSYMDVTKMTGDPEKGHLIFQTICIACHKIRGEGVEVGPDITDVRIKPVEALLTDILDPNRIVEPRFNAYQVDTKDGRILAGVVASENSDGVTLKMAGGASEMIPRANIKAMKCLDQSLMPVGLEAGINKQQMADLIAFLKGP